MVPAAPLEAGLRIWELLSGRTVLCPSVSRCLGRRTKGNNLNASVRGRAARTPVRLYRRPWEEDPEDQDPSFPGSLCGLEPIPGPGLCPRAAGPLGPFPPRESQWGRRFRSWWCSGQQTLVNHPRPPTPHTQPVSVVCTQCRLWRGKGERDVLPATVPAPSRSAFWKGVEHA